MFFFFDSCKYILTIYLYYHSRIINIVQFNIHVILKLRSIHKTYRDTVDTRSNSNIKGNREKKEVCEK